MPQSYFVRALMVVGAILLAGAIAFAVSVWLWLRGDPYDQIPDYPKSEAIEAASETLCPTDPDRFIPDLEAHADSGSWIVSFKGEPYGPFWYGGLESGDQESIVFTNTTRTSCGASPIPTPTPYSFPITTASQS